MIVDFLGVWSEPSLINLPLNVVGLAMLLGAVMLVLSRVLRWNDRAPTGRRSVLMPVAIRISRRTRHVSRCEDGHPTDMPSRAPPTLSRSDRRYSTNGDRSRE